jgi:hypothetical protein
MDHPIALHLPSKVFCALVGHAGEGCYGPKTEAMLCDLILHWIVATPAAPRPWLDDDDDDDLDRRDDEVGMLGLAPPPPPQTARLTAPATDTVTDGRGYQWKQVFLPNGTALRVIHGGRSIYAKVEDEQIISDGVLTTPSRLANVTGCGTRNAWRTIWLRFPGDGRWQRAAECRR